MSKSDRVDLLAFGAHPDDIEFGCGAVIAKETARGARVRLIVCSRGESGTHGTPMEREAEARTAAALLGAEIDFVELGGDAHLERTVGRALTLARLVRQYRPGLVLAPTVEENQHPDHAVVGSLIRDALRLARYGGVAELKGHDAHAVEQLLFYALSPDAQPRSGEILVNVSEPEVIARWTAAMEAHASQMKTRNYVELQLTRARLNGLRAGCAHAVSLFPNDPLVFDSVQSLGRAARRF